MYYPAHKIIFVAINKTGSTSVLSALNDALYSPEVPEIWKLKPFQNRQREHEYLKHAQAYFYQHYLGEEEFSQCFVMTQVRNPWDKMVSDFVFRCRKPWNVERWRQQRKWFIDNGLLAPTKTPDRDLFRRYVAALKEGDILPHRHWGSVSQKFDMPDADKPNINQLDGLTDLKGNILANQIIKLEELGAAWERVQHEIGERTGRQLAELPNVNRSEREGYKYYYDDDTAETVSALFQEDIRHFGYSF